ncbi:hypothetical protein SOVF_085750 [Spinacia oleracea]|nr:hypothetical protein SOVF_085750 [Spinacia oleracea]
MLKFSNVRSKHLHPSLFASSTMPISRILLVFISFQKFKSLKNLHLWLIYYWHNDSPIPF